MYVHALQPAAVLAVLRAARAQGLINDLDDIVSDIENATGNHSGGGSSGGGSGSGGSRNGDTATGSPDAGDSTTLERTENGSCGSASDDDDTAVRVPFALLWGAVASRQEALRVDALQLITTSVRTSFHPGAPHSLQIAKGTEAENLCACSRAICVVQIEHWRSTTS